jgi:hypothetical protein
LEFARSKRLSTKKRKNYKRSRFDNARKYFVLHARLQHEIKLARFAREKSKIFDFIRTKNSAVFYPPKKHLKHLKVWYKNIGAIKKIQYFVTNHVWRQCIPPLHTRTTKAISIKIWSKRTPGICRISFNTGVVESATANERKCTTITRSRRLITWFWKEDEKLSIFVQNDLVVRKKNYSRSQSAPSPSIS